MAFTYRNSLTGAETSSETPSSIEEILNFIKEMKNPGSTLITTLPNGIGLDFQAQDDGRLWMEIYADDLSSAFVITAIAIEIAKRLASGVTKNIKQNFSDLVSEWEY